MNPVHLELRHLRSIQAIHTQGGLARAADVLNITQSALSHQVKAIETLAGVELFIRSVKPMRLTPAGQRLLRLADEVLPMVRDAEADLRKAGAGDIGRLHIAMECHACFDWLLPVLDRFRRSFPEVEIDIRAGLAFSALPALAGGEIDVVISMDPEDLAGITFQPLFRYAPTLVVASSHELASRPFVRPEDLADQCLITYPMDRQKLDAFSQFLTPAGVQPREVRQVELTELSLMLVSAGRGVAVMPDWVLRRHAASPDLALVPLGEGGMERGVYAALRRPELHRPYIAQFLELARTEAVRAPRQPPQSPFL